MTLRPYQNEALSALLEAYKAKKRCLIVLPTGTGKTIVALALVEKVCQYGQVLWLAHRDELIEQPASRSKLFNIPSIGKIKGPVEEPNASLVLASVQTLSRPERLARINQTFSLVIVDEAHHAPAKSYRVILEKFCRDDTCLVGMTATPAREDLQSLASLFKDGIVYAYYLPEAINDGYLVDIDWQPIPINEDFTKLPTSDGDFAIHALEHIIYHHDIPNLVKTTVKSNPNRRFVIYTPTVNTAMATGAILNVPVITGETPLEERRTIIAKAEKGEINAIVNCAVLTEGWDCPPMDAVIIARPTRSQILYRQMIGRVLRPYPGKTNALVLDIVPTNFSSPYDLITAPLLFGLEPKHRKIKNLAEHHARRPFSVIKPRFSWKPAWVTLDDMSAYAVPTVKGLLCIIETSNGLWSVVIRKNSEITELSKPTEKDIAIAIAMDALRQTKKLASESERWRKMPPTEKQIQALKTWHINTTPSTRGEASDLLSKKILAQTKYQLTKHR